MNCLHRKRLPYILLLLILLLTSLYFYWESISFFPSHIHAWSQSDRFAIALRFLDNHFNLFRPQTYNLSTIDGITGVDLPIHEFIIALIMKLIGTEEPVVFRVYTLLYSFIGYFFLFRLAAAVTRSTSKALFITLFTFTCPVLVYYQAGFLPSATAFSTAWIGYYFYFIFQKNKNLRHLYLALGFMTLATLTRAPFAIFLFAISLHLGLAYFVYKQHAKKQFVALLIAWLAVLGYNAYKSYLNQTYGTQFLTALLPASSLSELFSIIALTKERWAFQLFTWFHYAALGLSLIGLAYQLLVRKRLLLIQNHVLLHGVLTALGASLYFVLMAKQYIDHEYYFIDSFYIPVILLFMLGIGSRYSMPRIPKLVLIVLGSALLIGATVKAKEVQQKKYAETLWDRGEVTRKNFIGSAAFLDSLGISRQANVLVIDAYSTNAPLILLDRRGYTVLTTSRENIEEALTLDFDVIVVQDVFLPSDVVLAYPEFLSRVERLGGNGKISVFRLSQGTNKLSLSEALGIDSVYRTAMLTTDSATYWVSKPQSDTPIAQGSFTFFDTIPFGPTYKTAYRSDSFNRLLVSASVYTPNKTINGRSVVNIKNGQETIYYWEFPITIFTSSKEVWQKYACLFTLPDNLPENAHLEWYVWNTANQTFTIDNVKLVMYKK